MQLAALQQAFYQAMVTGDCSEELLQYIVDDNKLDAKARLGVYRDSIQAGLFSAMRETYKATAVIIGLESFSKLAYSSINEHPSNSTNLNDYGDDFPDFIKEHYSELPFLSDLARFERVYENLFLTDAAAEFRRAEFIEALNTVPERAVLIVNPAGFIFKSKYPIVKIWEYAKDDIDTLPAADEPGDRCFVTCNQKKVYFYPLTADECQIINAIRQNCSILELGEIFGDSVANSLLSLVNKTVFSDFYLR